MTSSTPRPVVASVRGAVCPSHPTAAAVDLCARCGRFVCGDCAVIRGEASFCVECAKTPLGASTRANAALVLALVGFVLCGPSSVLAVALGRLEQRAIERQASPREGLGPATWAVRLGLAQLGLLALAVAGAIGFWFVART